MRPTTSSAGTNVNVATDGALIRPRLFFHRDTSGDTSRAFLASTTEKLRPHARSMRGAATRHENETFNEFTFRAR